MSEKRRDNKGRILKTGESQRKDLTYQYRYTDIDGQRVSVYARTLTELREKEHDIQQKLDAHISPSASNMTLSILLDKFMSQKNNLRNTTRDCYSSTIRNIKKDPFAQTPIGKIRILDAKEWLTRLHQSGYSFGTIKLYRSLLKSAFDIAVENDYILKNPFGFRMNFIVNDTRKKDALTQSEQELFLEFVKNSDRFSKYYDMCIVLVETGVRAAELCGITVRDVNLNDRTLDISHQLVRTSGIKLQVVQTKSESGVRKIPLSPEACAAFKRAIQNRPKRKIEIMVDGESGFVFETCRGTPYCTAMISRLFGDMRKEYEEAGYDLPHITPHILRHTYCTNLINLGVIPKHVQYLMGHSDINITLNTYTSADGNYVCRTVGSLYSQN